MDQDVSICHVNLAKGFRGGERQTQILIQTLAEKGIRQILVARTDSPLHQHLAGTEKLTHIGVRKPYMRGIPDVAKLKPSIVHAHDAKAAQWSLLNWWRHKTPYLITRRVPNPLSRNFFTRAVYRNAEMVVVLSNAIKYSVRGLLPDVDIQIIPSMYASFPVDTGKVDSLRRRYAGKFVVGHIGALVDHNKGQSIVIEAARRLSERRPELHYVFLGTGKDEQRLKKIASDRSDIEFIGFVSDVGNWIALFDLFVFPSYHEGLGSTLLDVMQGGCPIIASATDGILDVIEHEVNGLLMPPGNPEKLAAAIDRLYSDPELRERFVQENRQRLMLYSPKYIVGRYYELYQSILDGVTG